MGAKKGQHGKISHNLEKQKPEPEEIVVYSHRGRKKHITGKPVPTRPHGAEGV